MATVTNDHPDYDQTGRSGELKVKVICLGDSAVGKSKLVERFLMDGYKPQQLSTYALTLFQYKTEIDEENVLVGKFYWQRANLEALKGQNDFWDTAGQERFNSMHPSYYHQAHACILVFDTTRKVTYKNLPTWYQELRTFRPEIPCFCVANKIDVDLKVTQKSFNFPKKQNLPFYFVSASDGTNVVKLFRDAIKSAVKYKKNPTDFTDEVMEELERMDSGLTPFDEDEESEENAKDS